MILDHDRTNEINKHLNETHSYTGSLHILRQCLQEPEGLSQGHNIHTGIDCKIKLTLKQNLEMNGDVLTSFYRP